MYVMLHALTPRIAHLKNVMGPGSVLDSGGMIGFAIFWILTCFFLVIPVPKVSYEPPYPVFGLHADSLQMRGLVYAKLIVFVISAIAMCTWTLSLAGGVGAVARQPGTAHGSAKAWLIVRFLLLGAASCATFASNAADFQRYATKPNDVLLGNLIGFPVSNVTSSNTPNLQGHC